MKYFYLIPLLFGLLGCPTTPEETKPQLSVYWQMDLGINGEAPPVNKGDSIFFTAYPYLYAMSSEDSMVYWKSVLDESRRFQGDILLVDKTQIVLSQINEIKAFDRFNGTLLWEYNPEDAFRIVPLGNHSTHPSGYLFTAYQRKHIDISKEGVISSIEQYDSLYAVNGVLYNGSNLYVNRVKTVHGGLTRGQILVYNFASGQETWSYETDNGGFSKQPIIEGDILYAATSGNSPNGEVLALRKNDGEILWRTIEDIQTEKFMLTPEYVIVNMGSVLVAYLKTNGVKKWEFRWQSSGSLVKPAYLGGYVYMSNHNQLFVLDEKSGELIHSEPVPKGGSYFWHLAVSEDKLFAQTSTQLIAYEPWHLREE